MIQQRPQSLESARIIMDQSLALLKDHGVVVKNPSLPEKDLPNLIKACAKIHHRSRAFSEDPIRTVHHFACTGGTLIGKCIAASPGVRLLKIPLKNRTYRSYLRNMKGTSVNRRAKFTPCFVTACAELPAPPPRSGIGYGGRPARL